MAAPIYHEYEGQPRVVVLSCETCGCPVMAEFRNEHTLWHRYVDNKLRPWWYAYRTPWQKLVDKVLGR